jgi:Flp pilus assembly protein TadB
LGKTGKQKSDHKKRWKSGPRSDKSKPKIIEHDIEQDKQEVMQVIELREPVLESKIRVDLRKKESNSDIRSRNALEKWAYEHFSRFLPDLPRYKSEFEQAGLQIVFESFASTALLFSIVTLIATIGSSLAVLVFLLRFSLVIAISEAAGLGALAFVVSIVLWFLYPLQRRRSLKAKLESQLPYSFGILGVLSSAGISVERMFERIAVSDSNPILSELARRFIRNINIFGLDTESALKEVARHSPSLAFAKMLESIAVAFRTTGSVHDLIMFESNRLLMEKSDKMKKRIGDLSIMAELYITLVVVGPIIFIVMLSILQLLPYSGSLPTIQAINALVFVGIPVISIGFSLVLDSMVQRL